MSSNTGGASSTGKPIPSPTRMVIGGIPSNTSFKSKGLMGGGQDQDDEEQESFFMHPKNDNNFVDQENNHQKGLFNDGADEKEKNGVIS
jgi:hypothetical protein